MTQDAYKAAFEKAKADLEHAIKQRDYWNVETARLQQLVTSLAVSVAKPSLLKSLGNALVEVGFTDIVQSVVRSSPSGMTAIQVRNELEKRGYDFSSRQNPLALIHQTLKRLAAQNKVRDIGNGKYKSVMPFFGEY